MTGTGDVELDVEGVFSAGRTVVGRTSHGRKHSHGLLDTLREAHGHVGHPEVAAALQELISGVDDPAVKLPGLLSGVGDGVANTAVTARDNDNAGAHDVHTHAVTVQTLAETVNRVPGAPGTSA